MSALEAINGHATEVFTTYLSNLIKQRGLTRSDAFKKIYNNSLSDGYKVLTGQRKLTDVTAPRWAEVLGVSSEEILSLQPDQIVPTKKIDRRGKTPRKFKNMPPLRAHVQKLLVPRGWTETDLSKAIGLKTSAPLTAIMVEKIRLTTAMAERLATALEVPVEIFAKFVGVGRGSKRKSKITNTVKIEQVATPLVPVKTRIADGEHFSLIVDESGTASVKFDISGIPIDVALKIAAALNLPALLAPTKTPLKITHTRPERSNEEKG